MLLDHVTKTTPEREPHLIFGSMTAVLRTDRRTAILGRQGSGKTTLLQLLARSEPPDGGRIATEIKFSMVLNARSFLYSAMTGVENIEMLARVYGLPPKRLAALAVQLPGVARGAWLQRTGDLLPRARRAMEILTAALLPYDCYLLDDVERVEQNTMVNFLKLVRARNAGVIFTTFNAKFARQYADAGAVIANRTLRVFDSVEQAGIFYG